MQAPPSQRDTVVVIGGGPAGMTAAYALQRRGVPTVTLERTPKIGGLSRTEQYQGCRFDIGGHRFFTKLPEIQQLWFEMLGSEFREVQRLSRIFYRGRFFAYPLNVFDALWNLGPVESLRIIVSYLKAQIRPTAVEENLEQWVSNRFGERLYRTFFQSYTEKVWGLSCTEIRADWAAQRIKDLSVWSAVRNAILGPTLDGPKSLIETFHYPVHGPGMLWERFRDKVSELGGQVLTGAPVVRLERDGNRVVAAHVGGERPARVTGDQFISTMALDDLIASFTPAPPPEIREAAQRLRYRALVVVGLIARRRRDFKDNWIYVHDPNVEVGRIQNFRNWSEDMVEDAEQTSLGMEYFCNEGDAFWNRSDADLIAQAGREIVQLGLIDEGDLQDGVVFRSAKAYPVYDEQYAQTVSTLRSFLDGLTNFQTVGRNGLHRYNNQDHSMLTALLAARNLQGENHDLWAVNTERSYHEEAPAMEVAAEPEPVDGY